MHILVLPSWYPTPDDPIRQVVHQHTADGYLTEGKRLFRLPQGVFHVLFHGREGHFFVKPLLRGMLRNSQVQ